LPDLPPTRRLTRGSGHTYLLDGEPCPGVTTILNDGVPKPALVDWAARETAGYALDHWDELAADGSAQRLRKMEKGRFARQREATARGTKIHDYAHRLAQGEEVEVPEPYVAHVDNYLRFVDEWHVEDIAAEAVIVSRRWNYMGTLDLLAKIRNEQWLLDWKTGASGVFPETALQLAAYAHAETRLVAHGELALEHVDRAAAVWLRADGYDVIPVDISDTTFRTFLYVMQVAKFARAPRADYIGDVLAIREEAAS